MKKHSLLPLLAVLFVAAGCGNKQQADISSNPFFAPSKLPLLAPDFNTIKDADYQPAIEEGMKQQQAEIQKIAENTEAPTFENTLVELEKSGQMLKRVNGVFNLVTSANNNPELEKVQATEAPALAANQDAIYLNTPLYKRVEAVYEQRDKLKLDPESAYLLGYYKKEFELAGAKLSDAEKDSLKLLNKEEATLTAKFNSQLLAGTKAGAVIVNDKAEFKGLTDGALQAAAQNAKAAKMDGKWMLSLQNTTQQPALQSLTNRAARQKLFEASFTRTEKSDSNDTRKVIARIAQIRARKAKLVHFKNYAEWKLQDQMAENPAAVEKFMQQLVPAATAKANDEANTIQTLIDHQKGGFKLQPWDWNFYAEQVRKAKYDLDDNEIKPYFELNKVLNDGVFYAANQLYGVTFKERHDLPVYQKDVRVFDVFDKDGSQLGLFYCDYFKRDNKQGGAWMDNIVQQSKLLNAKPVIYNVCNFTKPAPGEPALISYDDAKTMFHEFGHGLHGLFANQRYAIISGSNTARDFVEFPSQFNEHWALDPKVLAHYAVHYKTGAPMPQALVAKIKNAATFNQGYALTEALAAADLDLQWHTLAANAPLADVDKFEADALHKTKLDLPQVPPRYRSSYFLHIWSNGYAAGYYAYAWTEMLDDDAFSWFQEHGGLTRENGQRFRDMILSRGNTESYSKMFFDFRGHNPDIHPMLVARGLVSK
jgi:peptidyl-dipeptidase Dcp